ncbi:MAG TPA: helix-turn-helix transcriptional regulator [Micromonosporaceae bacterium]|nr:helix-turn-helix transcriptional regulator [Micromonosporaceae bacterium]
MALGESPAVARRRLRIALRKVREARSLTQGQVASALDWSLSKVQRIESGEVTVSSTDLRALLSYLGITDLGQVEQMVADARTSRRRGWWDEPRYREHLTPATMQLLQFESEATAVRSFQPTVIPGLFQTRAYAEFVLNFWSDVLPDAHRAVRLEVRMRRQDHILNRPDPPQYLLILDESVLFREVGGPKVMAEQLHELLALARKPHVIVRVIPLAEAAVLVLLGPFMIFDLSGDENAVLYREGQVNDEMVDVSSLIQRHRDVFEAMWEQALSEEASTRLIEARASAMLSSLDRPRQYG